MGRHLGGKPEERNTSKGRNLDPEKGIIKRRESRRIKGKWLLRD